MRAKLQSFVPSPQREDKTRAGFISCFVKPDIDGGCGLDHLARRNIIYAGFRDGAYRVECHSAGGLQRNTTTDECHRLAYLIERHVVEHDDVGLGGEGLTHLVKPLAFDLD